MRGQFRLLWLPVFAIWWLTAPAFAQTTFQAAGLEPRIGLWKQVFTKYGADDVIVHDRFHVNLIYAVADDDTADETVRDVQDGLPESRERLARAGPLAATGLQFR